MSTKTKASAAVALADTYQSARGGDVVGARLDALAQAVRALHEGVCMYGTYEGSIHAERVLAILNAEEKLAQRAVDFDR